MPETAREEYGRRENAPATSRIPSTIYAAGRNSVPNPDQTEPKNAAIAANGNATDTIGTIKRLDRIAYGEKDPKISNEMGKMNRHAETVVAIKPNAYVKIRFVPSFFKHS